MDTYATGRPCRHESGRDNSPRFTEIDKGTGKAVNKSDTSNESQHTKQHGIQELFQMILRNGKDPDRPSVENILLVGLPGAGKSALLCTLNAALTGKYTPLIRQGRGVAQTNTLELRWLKKCGIREFDVEGNTNKKVLRELLPTLPDFWDFAGLGDENSAALEEILYLIINGYIPQGTNYRSLEKIQRDYDLDKDALRLKYNKQYPEWKITTVIFVHSCRVEVPKKLIKCLLSVLNETDKESGKTTYNGDVFVAMTKQDLADKPINDADGEASTHESSTDGQVPRVDTSFSVAEIERQLAAEFNMLGSMAFTSTKLTNYSDDSGYEYNSEIVRQHLQFLYLITLRKHRIEDTVTHSNIKMKIKLWLRKTKREMPPLMQHLTEVPVGIFITLFAIVVWFIIYASISI